MPVYKDYLWGGDRIPRLFGRQGAPEVCAESWEISAHPDGPSVVANGPLAGTQLAELATKFGTRLVGTRAPDPNRFPLLFKLIDAKNALSVQIHPNNSNASLTGGEPKTEMWIVLGTRPGACLYAGLVAGTTPESLRKAVADGSIEKCLVRLEIQPGQALFIPGGLVHAIGAGCLIYEVQQNSNTTYRFFDWNHLGKDGKPRKLHIEESFKTIDWALPVPAMRDPVAVSREGKNRWADVVTCPYFAVRQLTLGEPMGFTQDGSTFRAFFVAEGSVTITAAQETVTLGAGGSALLPAAAASFTVKPETPSRLFVTSLA
jgi:mannose-6-phosphate isomerase